MTPSRSDTRSGIALLIVIGVLAVMAALAMAFVTMAELERKASQQRMLSTKAYLLARSGIEDVLARLDASQNPTATTNAYGGEDWDGNGIFSAYESSQELYLPGAFNRDACPLRHAMRPSFPARFLGSSNPDTLRCEGRLRGYSGVLAGDYAPRSNTYALKVCRGGFYVNGGDPTQSSDLGYNAVLRRILGTLCEAIDREDGSPNQTPVSKADGENLVNLRPLSGWVSFDQIRNLALQGRPDKLDVLQPYLTLHSWVDKRVVSPNVTDGTGGSLNMVGKTYASWGQVKLDHRVNPSNPASRAPDFERMPPAAGGTIVGRAPVHLEWARSRRPALVALIAELKGLYLEELGVGTANNVSDGDQAGQLKAIWIPNSWTPGDRCDIAVSAILNSSKPLSTWQQWNDFCGKIPMMASSAIVQDLLKTNFNPNSDLNKFNPNLKLWKHMDKSDMLVYSTEFSLYPVGGAQVQSLGRVLDRNGRLLASRRIEVMLPPPGVVRLSTQKEFVCENLGDLDVPGDETTPRLPGFSLGSTSAFLSESQGNVRTWGHKLDTVDLASSNYDSSWMDGSSQGVGLQSYPEPYYDTTPDTTSTRLSIQPADYDGNLQLATIETLDNANYTITSTPMQNMMLLARFDDGFDLDLADAYPGVPDGKDCQADSSQVTTALLGNSIWASSDRIGTLYPDGGYSEKYRCPAYFDLGNANGLRPFLSFWVKRNISSIQTVRGSQLVNWTNRVDLGSSTDSKNQIFFLGCPYFSVMPAKQICGVFYKIGHSPAVSSGAPPGNGFEHGGSNNTSMRPGPHSWALCTVACDFTLATDTTGEAPGRYRFILSDGTSSGNSWTYAYGAQDPTTASDITLTDADGRHRIYLGPRGGKGYSYQSVLVDQSVGWGADATLDEFAIYDFGPGVAAPSYPCDDFAAVRSADGRYYKEATYRAPGAPQLVPPPGEAGSWISAPISLPVGALLKEVHWTWICPIATYSDYAEVELLKTDLTDYLWTSELSRSTNGPGWVPPVAVAAKQSWTVARKLASPFRARVVFRRAVPASVGPNSNILDSPVFNDLTFLYTPPGRVPILSWREGE